MSAPLHNILQFYTVHRGCVDWWGVVTRPWLSSFLRIMLADFYKPQSMLDKFCMLNATCHTRSVSLFMSEQEGFLTLTKLVMMIQVLMQKPGGVQEPNISQPLPKQCVHSQIYWSQTLSMKALLFALLCIRWVVERTVSPLTNSHMKGKNNRAFQYAFKIINKHITLEPKPHHESKWISELFKHKADQ